MALEIQHAALWKSITQRLNIEQTYTAHASFHTTLDIYVMAVGHNSATVDSIQYVAHSTTLRYPRGSWNLLHAL